MDRPQSTFFSLDELRQIQYSAQQSTSLDDLRRYFERIQVIRRAHADDFDLQLFTSEVQDQLLARARLLREEPGLGTPEKTTTKNGNPFVVPPIPAIHPTARQAEPVEQSDAAEVAPEVERLDAKTWQRATYLALFFAIILFAAFFYLVQTARRLNQTPAQMSGQQTAGSAAAGKAEGAAATASVKPALRLYTDLEPGTVTVDDKPAQDLKDGELILDNLEPGRHAIKVTGRSGDAAFSFDVAEKSAPKIIGLPTVSNVMAVLVSANDGKAHLTSNAKDSEVLLDGKPAGSITADGLNIEGLGTTDHLLQVTQNKDRQRFVLTYTATPSLTVYVKSDPNAGTVVVMAGQDGADVFVNNVLLKRKTVDGQLRIPSLRVGSYNVRVHKAGFTDAPAQTVDVKKAEETAVQFHLLAIPELATLEIRGAAPGTTVLIDASQAASIGPDGTAAISAVKTGDHIIEIRHDGSLSKRFVRTFHPQETVFLTGPDVTLDKVPTETKAQAAPPPPPPSEPAAPPQNNSMEIAGEQVRKGGGFVPYQTPKIAGRYSFSAQIRKGGVFKKGKLQWYAGFRDDQNYVVFTVDGKHATIRQVRDGKSQEINKVSFENDSNDWVNVDLSVKPNAISARVKSASSGWIDIGSIPSPGRDFTQDKVGLYVGGSDEVAVANFRFAASNQRQ